MIKKFVMLAAAIFFAAASAAAQDLPRIAVYATGDISESEKRALGTRMLASLINSGRYRGIERSNAFLAEIEREQTTQRSGAIDDRQIRELGKQFGVQYICIADITRAFGSFQLSARIVDVETAEVVLIGEAFSPLRTAGDVANVSDDVVRIMLGGQAGTGQKQAARPPERQPKPEAAPKPPREPVVINYPLWGGITLEAIGAGLIIYGLAENGNANSRIDKGEYGKADKSMKNRNAAYTVGTALLLGGISIHIFF